MDLMDFSEHNKITEHNDYTEEDIIRVVKSGGMVYTDSIHNLSNHNDDEPVQPIDVSDGNVIVLIDGKHFNTHLHSIYKLKEELYTPKFDLDRDKFSKTNQQGFNSEEDAREELDYLLDIEYQNLPDQIYLYRLLFIDEDQKLNDEELGDHWVKDMEYMLDKNFIDMIRSTSDAPWVEPVIIRGLFNSEDIKWDETLYNNMNFPNEFEITTGTEPLEYKVFTLKEFVKITESLGFEIEPSHYKIKFKQNTPVFVSFSNVKTNIDYDGHLGGLPSKEEYKEYVDMTIQINEGDELIVDIEYVDHKEDNLDISNVSFNELLQQTTNGAINLEDYSRWVQTEEPIGQIYNSNDKNGVIMGLSLQDVELLGALEV